MAPTAPESADWLPAPSDSCKEDRDRDREFTNNDDFIPSDADPAASRLLQCQQCCYKTSRKNRLQKHQNARHPAGNNNPNRCTHEGCGKTFDKKTSLYRHLEMWHNPDRLLLLQCQQCDYKTYRKYRLQCHQNQLHKHSITDKNVRKSEHTEYTNEIPSDVGTELTRTAAADPTASPRRGRRPRTNYNLNPNHVTCTHEGCGKSFSQLASLYGHLKTHDPDRLLYCEQCGYETYVMSRLRDHQNVKHRPNSDRFHCQQCDYKTYWKSSFQTHQNKRHGGTVSMSGC